MYTIGKLAEQASINVETVRYYERRGLRECKNICVNGILINSLEGYQNANIRQTYRSAA
ncbi:MerR family DNA-binding transcriptional regulator [Providencia rettgeri]